MTDYANPDALVSADWLADRLTDPHLRIVEVDEDPNAYDRGHIPEAIAWHWERDLRDPVRRDYLDRNALSGLLSRSGVDDGTTVVLYGGNHNWFAAYAYWLLRLRGFDRVKLLDGGKGKWEADGRPFVTAVPDVVATSYAITGPERPALRAYRDEILAGLDGTAYVDVRSAEEYSGERLAPPHLPQEQPYVGGYIPGAVNVPWARAVRDDGTFRPASELRAIYGGALADATKPVVAYCRIGERSSHTWFVLHELLGVDRVRNYDGSWTEYGSLVGVPVER